ncbi:MAG: spore germination protein [Firmicutes bacterium]|nr:spore germination protein [Bacillota bacterium]
MQLIGMFLQKLISLLSFNPPEDETRSDACAGREPNVQEQKMQKPPQDTRSGRRRIRARRKSAVSQNRVLPRRIEGINLGSKQDSSGEISPPDDSPSTGKTDGCEMKPLTKGLDANLNALKKILHHGTNADVVIREFDIPTIPETRASIIFIDSLASRDTIDFAILQPLMLIANLNDGKTDDRLEMVKRRLLPGNQVTEVDNLRAVTEDVLSGATCLLIEESDIALSIETRSWEHRSIDKPSAEMVVRGPQEAFNETLKSNLALIRRRMRTPDLISEMLKVGTLSRVDCAVLYIEGLTNPELVDEVKRRILETKADHIQDTGILEQFIEEKPYVLAPQTISTERPDRMAAFLAEGYVGIMLDGSPFGLVLPATFWSLLQSAEDYFLRWPFGAFLRAIRTLALILAIFLPAIYLALTNFHPEMIPTDLLLAIAASREKVPFPTAVEVLIMEISIELIREAGVRIPGVIGPTLGIVGALILGQAAVAASIVSPILVVIVAITALGAFAVPNFNMAFAIRLYRFVYVLLAAALGFYGVAIGVFIQLTTYVNLKSFGVPYMSPVAPYTRSSGDALFRYPVWKSEIRPSFLKPQQEERQPPISRGWIEDEGSGKSEPGGAKGKNHGKRK